MPTRRLLTPAKIEALLRLDVMACLATIDAAGFPVITPLWFVWDGDSFYMTSVLGSPHVRNLERDPRCSVCVDVEESQIGAQRPNQNVRARGVASVYPEQQGEWTIPITEKYLAGPEGQERARFRAASTRMIIRLTIDHHRCGFGLICRSLNAAPLDVDRSWPLDGLNPRGSGSEGLNGGSVV